MPHETPLWTWSPSSSDILYSPQCLLSSDVQSPVQLIACHRASPLTLKLRPLAPRSLPTGSKGTSLIKTTQYPNLTACSLIGSLSFPELFVLCREQLPPWSQTIIGHLSCHFHYAEKQPHTATVAAAITQRAHSQGFDVGMRSLWDKYPPPGTFPSCWQERTPCHTKWDGSSSWC